MNMDKQPDKRTGFTLIEIMISVGILGALSLIITALLLRSIDTYEQVMNDTDTIKQARQGINMIAREMREGTAIDISDAGAGGALAAVQDAILITSARRSDGTFGIDDAAGGGGTYEPVDSSIILFYIGTTNDVNAVPQLVRLQLYYAEDLTGKPTPFELPGGGAYSGSNVVILDGDDQPIYINRTTGSVDGVPPFIPQKVLMNRMASFDLVGLGPVEIRVAGQYVNRYGRTATSRVTTLIDWRNKPTT